MTATRFETLVYEKAGAIATLTINRPDRMNGMTNRMVLEAGEALARVAEDREVRVLILTGAGQAVKKSLRNLARIFPSPSGRA